MLSISRHISWRASSFVRTTSKSVCSAPLLSVRDALRSDFEKKVTVRGWIRSMRKHEFVKFVDVFDGSSPRCLQVTFSEQQALPESIRYGACISVSGKLVESQGKNQKIEMQGDHVQTIGECNADYPLHRQSVTKEQLELARKLYHFRPRLPKINHVLSVRSAANAAVHNYFHEKSYKNVHVPVLTKNNCEGGSDVFEVTCSQTSDKDYFPWPVFLTVSGQLHLEALAAAFPKVYSFGPAFRADSATSRWHLSEFYMIEAELAFVEELSELLEVVEDMYKSVTQYILQYCCEELEILHADNKGVKKQLMKNLETPFHKVTYTDAVSILTQSEKKFDLPISWGKDLGKAHEKFIVQHFNDEPVFVTDFPCSVKPFYMKRNSDGETVACFDLLVPGIGELAGGSLREDDINTLEKTLEQGEQTGTSALDWYLDLRRYGSCPHGGFGIGFERYLQSITGIAHIRDTIPFPRFKLNCTH